MTTHIQLQNTVAIMTLEARTVVLTSEKMVFLRGEEATSEIPPLVHTDVTQGLKEKGAVCSQPATPESHPCYHAGMTLAAFTMVRKPIPAAAVTHYAITGP